MENQLENGKCIEKDNYKFFQNRNCEYFPCHKIKNIEDFNCLFCYCPLYALKDECGGNFSYLDSGIKNCMDCILPHIKDIGYQHIQEKITKMIKMAKKY